MAKKRDKRKGIKSARRRLKNLRSKLPKRGERTDAQKERLKNARQNVRTKQAENIK